MGLSNRIVLAGVATGAIGAFALGNGALEDHFNPVAVGASYMASQDYAAVIGGDLTTNPLACKKGEEGRDYRAVNEAGQAVAKTVCFSANGPYISLVRPAV